MWKTGSVIIQGLFHQMKYVGAFSISHPFFHLTFHFSREGEKCTLCCVMLNVVLNCKFARFRHNTLGFFLYRNKTKQRTGTNN